jgi:hypothetical protein
MKVIRHDGIEVEISLDEPRVKMYDKIQDVTTIKGHCNICKCCWIGINHQNKYFCIYGGPFKGYINMVTGEITT